MQDEKSEPGWIQNIFSHLKLSIIAGLLVSTPFLLTGWLLFKLFGFIDSTIEILPITWQPKSFLGRDLPGLGILLSILFIYLCGLATHNYAGKQMVRFYETLLTRVPLINGLYQAIKQFVSTLFSEKGNNFREVVLVEYPRKGIFSFAFLTNQKSYLQMPISSSNDSEKHDLLSIFLPSTPNPTTGFYLLIPKKDVWSVDLSVEEAFKLIMSAGIVTPDLTRKARPYGLEVHQLQLVSPNEDRATNLESPTMT